ncbi:Uncharacterised protein [uncultured archaeon]|nr:Uncharacterised protein [uncultured archaeon]
MTSRSTWKALERKAAKKLGGVRNPLSGSNSMHTSGDVIHDCYYIECKLRQKWAITGLFKDVMDEAKAEGKTPLLVIKEKGKHSELVVMDMADFMQITGAK